LHGWEHLLRVGVRRAWDHKTVMNATRTMMEELSRWQRGIARALLLLGALAGMTLGSVAHAQITFRNASSATALAAPSAPTAPPGATGTVKFQAAGTAQSGLASVSPAWPAHAIDDIALLFTEPGSCIEYVLN
jgi:hypothetical protein